MREKINKMTLIGEKWSCEEFPCLQQSVPRFNEDIDCTYSEGYVTFSTNHFSTYAIVNEPSQNADGGMSIGLIIGGAVAAIAVIAAAVFLFMRKH